MQRHYGFGFLVALATFAITSLACAEQTDTSQVAKSAAQSEVSPEAALEAKQETVSSQLREAMNEQSRDGDGGAAAAATTELSEVEQLKLIEVIVAQQRSATSTLRHLQSKAGELKTQLDRLDMGVLDEKPPYSILVLDRLTDSIASSAIKRASIEESLLAARENVERARHQVDALQKSLRQLKEEPSSLSNSKIGNVQLEVRMAEEMLLLRRQELDIEEANDSVLGLEAKIDERKRFLVSQQVVFDSKVIDEKNVELDAREVDLKNRAEQLLFRAQEAERKWMAARQQVDATNQPTPEILQQTESLKIAMNTIQVEIGVNNQRIHRLPMMRASWDRRFRVATKQATRKQQKEWLAETIAQMEDLSRDRRSRELKLNEARAALAAASTKKEEGGDVNPEVSRWLDHAAESLSNQIEFHNRAIVGIDSGHRALSRLRVEIEGQPSRSFDQWISDAWDAAKSAWNYELSNINDTSLTVGRVVSCLLFLCIGYIGARCFSRLLGSRLPKLGFDLAAAHAVESLSFYAFMIVFSLMTLRFANVPLTAFTFLGGAIAIGVGFGSQNLMNNFISGLILLAERPIKAGDLIQIDGNFGNVTQIGARSTKIRTGDNLDIIVPNSKFLENNVVNLTYGDDRLRSSVRVGVAYGSPLDLVMELLFQAADENPNIESSPEPIVWFNDFGDNSLEFQVGFWIRVRAAIPRKTIETQVRLAIDRLFREHSITIPFPHRDVNFKPPVPAPLEFRIVSDDDKIKVLKVAQ
jgi:potassium-dependent mechanosensitive channel